MMFLLATAILSVFCVSLWRVKARKEKAVSIVVEGLPMVPNPHWILGHARMLFGNEDFRRGQYEATLKYADSNGMSSFWVANIPAVSVILGKDVKAALNASSHRGSNWFLSRHMSRFFGPKALAALTGKEWKFHRAAVSRAFTPASLRDYQTAIDSVGNALVDSLKRAVDRNPQSAHTEVILPIMKMATMDVFGRTAFGVDMKCCAELETSRVAKSFEFLSAEWTRRLQRPLDVAANLYWLPTGANRRHARERTVVRSFIAELVEARRNELECTENSSKRKDLLSHLLHAEGTVPGSGTASKEVNLSGDALADTLVMLLFAGYDSTSISLTYALYLLATHPEVEESCVAEARSVLSAGRTSETRTCLDDPEALPYTKAVILETLRLYPPSYLTVRRLEQPLKLNGVTIPVGTMLNVPIWTIHRDERNFPKPDEFLPERWVEATNDGGWAERYPGDKEEDVTDTVIPAANRDAFCAFSGGARNCVGRKLAVQEATSLLAFLLKDLKFEVDPDYALVPQSTSFMQQPSDGIPMVIKHR